MKDEQMDIYSVITPVPEMWECMKSCANCGKRMSQFPNGEPRCDLSDMVQEVFDNRVFFWCRNYKAEQGG